jgi:ribosomal protein S18 acetylase RimI-like enzyme
MYEIFRVNGQSPLYEVQESDDLIIMCHGAKEATYQGVGLANLSSEDIDRKIESVLSYFVERKLPFVWYIGPDTKPSNLGDILNEHGLKYIGEVAAMAIKIEKLKLRNYPKDLTIERVKDEDQLRTFFDVWIESYPFPPSLGDIYYDIFTSKGFKLDYPNKFYVGYLEGTAVATSRVFYGRDLASLWWVSTHPSARGRGIATAMTINPLRDSQSYGYKMASLFATNMGSYVYPKLGFKEYHKLGAYVWSPE